jgi:membrane fusion protein (multidrug efflux system)
MWRPSQEKAVMAEAIMGRVISTPRRQRTLLVLVVALVAAAGAGYWLANRNDEATDDAYVNAHVVQVSPQVGGAVVKVAVVNNAQVRKGDLLFEIDPAPYRLKVQEAQTQLAIARQNVNQEEAAVAEAEALVEQRKAELAEATARGDRTLRLVADNVMSHAAGDTARTGIDAARAALGAAQATLQQAQANLGKRGNDNTAVRAALTRLSQAQLDLDHTRVVAPDDGYVTELSLHAGAVVAPSQPLFAFVSEHAWWVDANFKETQLQRIRPGQPAQITVDMYPGHVFRGVVDSISRGSGTAFALLPPQNATGNWVKVTQRVPVKVMITDNDPQFPLRVGTSATVSIDVRS